MTSCTTVTTYKRKGLDTYLNKSNGHRLNGVFSIVNKDYIFSQKIPSSPRLHDLPDSTQIRVRLELIEVDKIKMVLYAGDSVYGQRMLQGKFRRGYFKFKRSWEGHMVVGPIIWGLSNSSVFLGTTNDGDLVALSATGGLGFLVVIPGFASGGQFVEVYYRVAH